MPFAQIVPIRQGNAALLLPLARFRLEADGAAPVVRTFVVGQPSGANAALQPFRLDLGPRVYPQLGQHARRAPDRPFDLTSCRGVSVG